MVTDWMTAGWTRFARVGALVLGLGAVSGCAAALPAVGDAASTAVSATVALFEAGQAVSYEPVSIEEATAVVQGVQQELDLIPIADETSPDRVTLCYQDQRDQEIVVTLVRRTRRVTAIYVEVGLFGKMGMADLVLRQIQHDLPAAATKPSGP